MLNIHYVVGHAGVDLSVGVIRIVVTALAQASFSGIVGYFLAQDKFEGKPVWWMPAGVALAAVLNGAFIFVRDLASVRGLHFNPRNGLILATLVALAILGGISVSTFKHAIASGDARLLASIHGIGQKTAERLIVELKDKITLIPRLQEEAARGRLVEVDQKISDVLEALISLGYSHLKAHKAIKKALESVEPESSVEELLKESLGYI